LKVRNLLEEVEVRIVGGEGCGFNCQGSVKKILTQYKMYRRRMNPLE
jgi:hypothetical protein